MSPWWSRPTADDVPEDFEPEEELGQDDTGDENEDTKKDASPGRRRRRASPRKSSEAEPAGRKKETPKKEASKKAAPKKDSGTKDTEDRKPGRRRRRRRRTEDDMDAGPEKAAAKKRDEPKKSAQPKSAQPKKQDEPRKKDDRKAKEERKKEERKREEPKRERAAAGRGKGRSGDSNGGPSRRTAELTFDGSAEDVVDLSRELDISDTDRSQAVNDERKIALFCDLENIALGVRDSSEVNKFDILLVLERLLEKGKIIVKKAYCDWERYSDYKRAFHEAAIEMIDIPQKYYSGKNSADIKMVVDAMDLSYSKEHLDTFVVLSGDSDFSPLVSKLKENNKYVIGVGVKNSSSNLLVNNCDEFIYYEDIWRDTQQAPKLDGLDSKTAKAFQLMVDSIQALVRENKDVLWGSMIKQTMQRKKPSFNEGYYGYGSFSELLEDAEKNNIVKLKKDKRSGSYIVTGFA